MIGRWSKESAYEAGFLARIERVEQYGGKGMGDFPGFALCCPQEFRESGEYAAKLRNAFVRGWKEGGK